MSALGVGSPMLAKYLAFSIAVVYSQLGGGDEGNGFN